MHEPSPSQEPKPNPAIEQYDLSFEKRKYRPDVVTYVFKDVVVKIDTTGKNFTELPELIFGTFEFDGSYILGDDIISQPDSIRPGVDAAYISACIGEVAKDSGVHQFWLYFHGEDKPTNPSMREEARYRLFKKYLNLTPFRNNYGYTLNI